MHYINKKEKQISLETRQLLEKWKEGKYTHNRDITNGERLKQLENDDLCTGETIWKFIENDGRSEKISKRFLKRAFLIEQGFVCCYCGIRIFNDHNTRIEHIAPKESNKNLVYDYDNLLASCYGSSKNIFHKVENKNDTAEKIAAIYGVDLEQIEELYVNEDNIHNIDIENLKINDKILVIKKLKTENQHCDIFKDNNPIKIHPLVINCQKHFKYNTNGEIVTDDAFKATVEILGLNNNKMLKVIRKRIIDKTLFFIRNVMQNKLIDNKKAVVKQYIEKLQTPTIENAPRQNFPDGEYFLRPFYFITIAVLEGRVIKTTN